MKALPVTLVAVAIFCCTDVVVAQNFRGTNNLDNVIANEADGGQFSEIIPRLLKRNRNNRAHRGRKYRGKKWDELERPTVERDGEDDSSSEDEDDWRKKVRKWKEKLQAKAGQTTESTKPTQATSTTEATRPQVATLPPKATMPPIATAPPKKTEPELPETTETPNEIKIEFYESTSGAFDVKIPLFSSASVLGYGSDDRLLYNDLVEATKFKVNRIIEYNIKNNYYYRVDVPMMAMALEDPQPMAMSVEASMASPVANDVSDYGTNNVEAGIDEGDAVKTNGRVACASYGDTLIFWNAKAGTYISNITLPPLENTDPFPYNPGPFPQPRPLPILVPEEPPVELVEEVEAMESRATTLTASRGNRNGRDRKRRRLLSIAYVPMKPNVESLLLHDDKLVVIASGYGQDIRSKLNDKSTLNEAFNTNIRIYDLSSLEKGSTKEPTLLKETNVHGRFDSIRADGSNVHLTTFSNINMYNFFDEHLSRYQPKFQGMDDAEYTEAAKKLAQDSLIPKFIDQLIKDLTLHGEKMNLGKVCMWQRRLSSTNSKLEDSTFEGGIMQALAQVTSFGLDDASMTSTRDKQLRASASGILMPTGYGHVYATNSMLVIAGQGWDWIEEWRGSVQTTYFIGFALQKGGKTVPVAVGSLQGTIIGDYSVDIVDKYMRVAVSIRNDLWRFQGDPPADMPPTENYIRVLQLPDLDNNGECTGNCILQQVGSSESFGKEGETFRGVRFSDRVAYVVTFLQTDPFYVVEFATPTEPKMAGELEKTGFSSYLHFINDKNTMLLGVGQEADADGGTLGVQIVLYDATNPAKPKDIQTFDYVLDESVRAYSSVLFDPKAFRYVPLKDEEGILIMPMRLDVAGSTEGNFDGFILFDISPKAITERFSIPHVDSDDFRNRCYGSNQLKDRSFVINGDVTTLKKHSIRQYNLDTRKPVSKGMDLDSNIVVHPYMGCLHW